MSFKCAVTILKEEGYLIFRKPGWGAYEIFNKEEEKEVELDSETEVIDWVIRVIL